LIGYREIASGLRQLGLDPAWPVIVHASLSSFGDVRGGTGTLLGALLSSFQAVMMPAFTYKTMLVPEEGPPDNGMEYGQAHSQNLMAEFFQPDMPADPSLGSIPETLRVRLDARRSLHPILSFTGVGIAPFLATQSLAEPLAPVGAMAERGGWALLMGVNQTTNTSLHYAERQAGRPQFTRWALTYEGVRECPGFPGCSNGFEKAGPWLDDITRRVQIGNAQVRAIPLKYMMMRISDAIHRDPQAFLCDQADCALCNAVRRRVQPVLLA
jgi:aminoglycoside 3-N-acetyltransferase